jgi:hypothetical protein
MKFNKSFNFTIRLGGAPAQQSSAPPTSPASQEPAAAPTGSATDVFKPAATRYRGHLGRFVAAAVVGIFLSALSLLVSDALFPWLAYPGVGLIALSLVIFFTLPSLVCPACGRSADGFDAYCPSCGAPGLKRNRLMGTPCGACGKTLGGYKYRNYKIRFCTHCGTLLDSGGV